MSNEEKRKFIERFHRVCEIVIKNLRKDEKTEKIPQFSVIRRDGNYQAVLFKLNGIIGVAASVTIDLDGPEVLDVWGNSKFTLNDTREWHEVLSWQKEGSEDEVIDNMVFLIYYVVADMMITWREYNFLDLEQEV